MRLHIRLILFLVFVNLTASAHTVVEKDGYYEVEHSWKYDEKECSITLNISMRMYDYYQNDREHLAYVYQIEENEVPPNYYSFMLSEHDRPVMHAIAEEFSNYALNEKDRISLALTFVQSLPYAYDADSKGVDEYVRYPIETLVDGCGDCEDKVALLTALLYEMDIDFILLVLPEHMAIGVHCDEVEAERYLQFQGKKYYYMETTMPNWQIGQIPEDYHKAKMEAIPLDDTPSLLFKGVRFESSPTNILEKADCSLELDLQNLGPGRVTELWAHVQVIEQEQYRHLLAEKWFQLDDLAEGESRKESLSLKSLVKENCVLQVELSSAETEAQSYSVRINYTRMRN